MSDQRPAKETQPSTPKDRTLFPDVIHGEMNTAEFLAAAQEVVKIVEKLGKIFAPVKYDMQGNIDKLNARYSKGKEGSGTLQGMILEEKNTETDLIATDALMWLTRGLHMVLLFFEQIVQDHNAGSPTDDLAVFLRNAYKQALEPYHGWMAQQLFSFLSRMVPTRTQLLQALADGETGKEEETLRRMEVYLVNLRTNVTTIQKFYRENDLEDNRVV